VKNGVHYDQFLSVILDTDWALREMRYTPRLVS
jgi:hypothetical protein